jgi:hypothetical protein
MSFGCIYLFPVNDGFSRCSFVSSRTRSTVNERLNISTFSKSIYTTECFSFFLLCFSFFFVCVFVLFFCALFLFCFPGGLEWVSSSTRQLRTRWLDLHPHTLSSASRTPKARWPSLRTTLPLWCQAVSCLSHRPALWQTQRSQRTVMGTGPSATLPSRSVLALPLGTSAHQISS